MKRKLLLTVFSLAAAVLGGCENASDLAKKSAVVDLIEKNSLEKCDTGPNPAAQQAYAAQLRSILTRVRAPRLDALKESGVTVCLDYRMPAPPYAIYYRASNTIGLVAFENYEFTWGNQAPPLEKIAELSGSGSPAAQSDFAFAVRKYRGRISVMTWTTDAGTSKTVFSRKPALKTPPLKPQQ